MKNALFLMIFVVFGFARQDYAEMIDLNSTRMKKIFDSVKIECENGNFNKCNTLAKFYSDEKYAKSINLKLDFKKAKELSKIACESGNNAIACINLAFYKGDILTKQIQNKEIFKKGFDELRKKCDDKNGLACYQMALWQNRCNETHKCFEVLPRNENMVEIYLEKFEKLTKQSCQNGEKMDCIKLINCYNGTFGICQKDENSENKADDIWRIYMSITEKGK